MPDRPHHSDKMKSCVEKVMAEGKDESSAYAICTVSLQKAGEPIFEAAEAGSEEELALLGGPGSGNFGHSGRPGERGGSGDGGDGGSENIKLPGGDSGTIVSKTAASDTRDIGNYLTVKTTDGTKTKVFEKRDGTIVSRSDGENYVKGFFESSDKISQYSRAPQQRAKLKEQFPSDFNDGAKWGAENQPELSFYEEASDRYDVGSLEHNAMLAGYAFGKTEAERSKRRDYKPRDAEGAEEVEEESVRHLHLLGATGRTRTEMVDGREHLVVPVVALMEGVIHAINAEAPEFVPGAALSKEPQIWDGHPVMLGHPVKDGKQISAHDDIVLEAGRFGTIRQSHAKNNRLGMEALIDPDRLEKLGHKDLVQRFRAHEPIEVSVGAFVRTKEKSGTFNGKAYQAEWAEIRPDHLAFLPKGRGACSLEMGCGSGRHAMEHLITAEDFTALGEEPPIAEELNKLMAAIAKRLECEACKGSGNKDGNPCEVCDGKGELKVAAGARHSAEDVKAIQDVHDHAVALGAKCDAQNTKWMEENPTLEAKIEIPVGNLTEVVETKRELKAACSCENSGDKGMTKEEKAEKIRSLVTNRHSGFSAGDEPMLELASDERIETFLVAAEARVKEVERIEKLQAPRQLTEEDFMKVAPAEIKTLIERTKNAETTRKAELVDALKTAQSEYTESELAAMPLDVLERTARLANIVEEKPDYSGRAVPRTASEAKDNVFTNPPDPYEEGLKTLRAASSTH